MFIAFSDYAEKRRKSQFQIFSFFHRMCFSFPPSHSTNKIQGLRDTLGTGNTCPLPQPPSPLLPPLANNS